VRRTVVRALPRLDTAPLQPLTIPVGLGAQRGEAAAKGALWVFQDDLALMPDEGKVIKLKRELVVGYPSTRVSDSTSPRRTGWPVVPSCPCLGPVRLPMPNGPVQRRLAVEMRLPHPPPDPRPTDQTLDLRLQADAS